jgi:hypothetical protein
MTKLEEYQAKKASLEAELENINREIILTEQTVEQQKELFQNQFGTTDIEELKKIAAQYQESIVTKEAELMALEQAV